MIEVLFFDPRKPLQEQKGGLWQIARDAMVRLNDLIRRTGGEKGHYMAVPSKTVAQLQAIAANAEDRPEESAIAYCSNETGGLTLVFYDIAGAQWRRVQDRVVIS